HHSPSSSWHKKQLRGSELAALGKPNCLPMGAPRGTRQRPALKNRVCWDQYLIVRIVSIAIRAHVSDRLTPTPHPLFVLPDGHLLKPPPFQQVVDLLGDELRGTGVVDHVVGPTCFIR